MCCAAKRSDLILRSAAKLRVSKDGRSRSHLKSLGLIGQNSPVARSSTESSPVATPK